MRKFSSRRSAHKIRIIQTKNPQIEKMMQASEQNTSTQSSRRRNWFLFALLGSVVLAGIVGLTRSLTNDSRNKQKSTSSSVAHTTGLRGSPIVDDGAVPADPTTDATSNAGDKPASGADEGDTMQQNGGDNDALPSSTGSNPDGGAVEEYTNKTSWPELLGKPGEEARSTIMRETLNMALNIELVPVGSMVTADWREDRVRIDVEEDEAKTVAAIPNIG
jgi:Potato inhibitor I family